MKTVQDVAARLRKYTGRRTSRGCTLWTGHRSKKGYGKTAVTVGFKVKRSVLAHRLAYETFVGPIPDGLCVLHRCDNPPCVNVEHLFLGTNADNTADMVSKGRNDAPRGEAHAHAILTDDAAREMHAKAMAGAFRSDLAAEYGVSVQVVNSIVCQRAWKHLNLPKVPDRRGRRRPA